VLLWVTVAVSAVHIVFDILAFKNDIGFWRSRRDNLEGISVAAVAINAVFRVVIFFYLLDNDTSLLVLFPSGFSALVDAWKLTKAFRLRLGPARLFGIWLPRIVPVASYSKGGTSQYDRKAFRALSVFLAPVIVGYSTYTLVWVPQRGWYSWALGSATSVVYGLGFIMMTPQLFINYKLRSVAHLPWRALVYRALNTFIDDLFAFIIKMPTLHRISCFRDDAVFVVYLFQRWKYPVDITRASDGAKPTSAPLPPPHPVQTEKKQRRQ
jgi:hypothetical protein